MTLKLTDPYKQSFFKEITTFQSSLGVSVDANALLNYINRRIQIEVLLYTDKQPSAKTFIYNFERHLKQHFDIKNSIFNLINEFCELNGFDRICTGNNSAEYYLLDQNIGRYLLFINLVYNEDRKSIIIHYSGQTDNVDSSMFAIDSKINHVLLEAQGKESK